jgi:hypothetical protein
MKLVRIEHSRCNEYDGTEYMLAPDDWNEYTLEELIEETVNELIADAKAVKDPPFGEPRPFQPDYDKHPDLKVSQVQALHATQKEEYKVWREENNHLERSFEERLTEKGFIPIWHQDADTIKVKTYWGHNHGLTLNYKHFKGFSEEED